MSIALSLSVSSFDVAPARQDKRSGEEKARRGEAEAGQFKGGNRTEPTPVLTSGM